MGLTNFEKIRYARHLILPEVGLKGQEKLKSSSALVIGAGGLGSAASLYLAAAGVGRIGLVDPDRVSLSNLQRQILYSTRDEGSPKTLRAKERLQSLNPEIQVETFEERYSATHALTLLENFDIVLDGTDNFPSRYLINDACVIAKKPLIHGAISRFDAQVSVFAPGSACYRCLYPLPPAGGAILDCNENGVLGVLPGLVGVIQATEALKWLLGIGDSLAGRLLVLDALRMSFESFHLEKNEDCICAEKNVSKRTLVEISESCPALNPAESHHLNWRELESKMRSPESSFLLLDIRSLEEYENGHLPGAHHLPLSELKEKAGCLPRDQEIVLYCSSGVRSGHALSLLQESGFNQVFHLRGGLSALSP